MCQWYKERGQASEINTKSHLIDSDLQLPAVTIWNVGSNQRKVERNCVFLQKLIAPAPSFISYLNCDHWTGIKCCQFELNWIQSASGLGEHIGAGKNKCFNKINSSAFLSFLWDKMFSGTKLKYLWEWHAIWFWFCCLNLCRSADSTSQALFSAFNFCRVSHF